ncbi:gamma-aminobutyric acid receptor subunit alpha-1 isoform X2 [Lepeophtheirus salmonis]|uniref:gamma-aminobutyric acid receptor subunit alpha-1 isoform X2 n=1 Tax=Lepeophtheirus salmonis TaxID=72036 RepID=UPI001AE8E594|nr:gamma-aminobutyric acid receptor alpha-like isoform X2 [Lepeophtheirus salmonis]
MGLTRFLLFLFIISTFSSGTLGKTNRNDRQSKKSKEKETISDTLSKNITMILEDLLKNYDKTERPSFRKGVPTDVKINILIRSMGPISEEDMNYSMDCYFRQYWRDERLSFTGLKNNTHHLKIDQLSLNVKMLEKIWKPDTYFHNGLSSYIHTITRPNKLLRISEHGDITYSMRLTIKAKCPMMLKSFPMDWQSCPLVLGSYAYTIDQVYYRWQHSSNAVAYEGKLKLSQFDIITTAYRSLNFSRNTDGGFSVLQVVIALQRHTGYFLIQIYLPCTLIVVLSWVGFWLNREATSDRVGLGITTVLTLSTIALDSRTDLPKVHYATALDWFIICSFGYCIATLLEFAGVHYFTKMGSGEVYSLVEFPHLADLQIIDEEEKELEGGWTDNALKQTVSVISGFPNSATVQSFVTNTSELSPFEDFHQILPPPPPPPRSLNLSTSQREVKSNGRGTSTMSQAQTQTETTTSCFKQFLYCLMSNQEYRKEKTKEATRMGSTNSTSKIDSVARILFPVSFCLYNAVYWYSYFRPHTPFDWKNHILKGNILEPK